MQPTRGSAQEAPPEVDLDAYEAVACSLDQDGYPIEVGLALWPALDQLTANNAKGEVFLTDAVAAVGGADTVTLRDLDEAMGVNDRVQLAAAERV